MPNKLSHDVLLLDFGGVCLLNPVELHSKCESELGLEPGSLTWMGPLDPATDSLWQEMVSGRGLTERQYWARRSVDVGKQAGIELDLKGYIDLLYNPPTPEIIRPEATATVEAALRAGYRVSVFTNDLRAFHGSEWASRIEFLDLVDHLIDCSDTGILKPDPAAFERAVSIVEAPPERILFVDDQPLNAEGGTRAGLDSLWFDIANAEDAWAQVADRLGIS